MQRYYFFLKPPNILTSFFEKSLSLLLFVVPQGFEPCQTEPKPVVLPLHHGTGLTISEGRTASTIGSQNYKYSGGLVSSALSVV